jgi:hypothetical protein
LQTGQWPGGVPPLSQDQSFGAVRGALGGGFQANGFPVGGVSPALPVAPQFAQPAPVIAPQIRTLPTGPAPAMSAVGVGGPPAGFSSPVPQPVGYLPSDPPSVPPPIPRPVPPPPPPQSQVYPTGGVVPVPPQSVATTGAQVPQAVSLVPAQPAPVIAPPTRPVPEVPLGTAPRVAVPVPSQAQLFAQPQMAPQNEVPQPMEVTPAELSAMLSG